MSKRGKKGKREKPIEVSLFGFMYESRTYTLLTLSKVVLFALGVGALIRELSLYGGYSILGMCIFLVIYELAVKFGGSKEI